MARPTKRALFAARFLFLMPRYCSFLYNGIIRESYWYFSQNSGFRRAQSAPSFRLHAAAQRASCLLARLRSSSGRLT